MDVFALPLGAGVRNAAKWPMKIGDFMAAGRPTVSNPVGEMEELFEREPIGLLAAWDPADFAEKIVYILENHNLREDMGIHARYVAENRLSWGILADRLVRFYGRFL